VRRVIAVVITACVSIWPGAVRGQGVDHSQHQQGAEPAALPPFIPPVTEADRAAAFPDVHGHAAHDNGVNYFVLFDQLEWQAGSGVNAFTWDDRGWVGRDLDRVWFRTEGVATEDGVEDAEAHLLYGRAIARWWDLVGGIRQDVRPGSPQTWAAFGVQGLAPYWFELAATGYVGAGARTSLRLEAEYELLLTNRLILKPLLEVDIHGRSDRERGIGAGLSSADAGFRVRYEFRREVAPYVGLVWSRMFFGTADFARAAGERTGGGRLAVGLRVWL
jgi:copper resistance protein B